jgi:hypothetical protein
MMILKLRRKEIMSTVIDELLDKYDELSFEEKEYLLDVLQHRIVEYRRMEMAEKLEQAEKDYLDGKSKSGSVDDLFEDLEND